MRRIMSTGLEFFNIEVAGVWMPFEKLRV